MSKQPPPAPTASAVGPCPTVSKLQDAPALEVYPTPSHHLTTPYFHVGWSGGAKVLGKLPVPGRPTFLESCRARVYCACNRCGWGLFGHFFL